MIRPEEHSRCHDGILRNQSFLDQGVADEKTHVDWAPGVARSLNGHVSRSAFNENVVPDVVRMF